MARRPVKVPEFPGFLLDVFMQSKAPIEDPKALNLPPEEEQNIRWLRDRYSRREYDQILKRLGNPEECDVHTLLYAAMCMRDLGHDPLTRLSYLYEALRKIDTVRHPYMRALILIQIGIDTRILTGDFGLARAIAAEAILAAPDCRYRCWTAYTNYAEYIIQQTLAENGNMGDALEAVDIVFEDLQRRFPEWSLDEDFRHYMQRQAQLLPYRESEAFRRRFPGFVS